MINSKGKGSSFERKVCTTLSLWVTEGKQNDCFWRSSISGGRATVAHNKGKTNRQAGDICSVSPEGHILTEKFFIECKHYRKLQIDKFILLKEGTLAKFWVTCNNQAFNHKRWPMLIVKENGKPELVITYQDHLTNFCNVGPSLTTGLTEIRLFRDLLQSQLRK